jgi:hypothetical protein
MARFKVKQTSFWQCLWDNLIEILVVIAITLILGSLVYSAFFVEDSREYVSPGIYRTKVEGGYLYETFNYGYGKSIEFVPDQQ